VLLLDMELFTPKKIIDPITGKERIVSSEEQELMLEKGILFDIPFTEVTPEEKSPL